MVYEHLEITTRRPAAVSANPGSMAKQTLKVRVCGPNHLPRPPRGSQLRLIKLITLTYAITSRIATELELNLKSIVALNELV